VERTELLGAERRVAFDRELGDRLTDIAVVVNYLRDGEPAAQQVPPVLDRSRGGSGARGGTLLALERLLELPQEQRDPLLELGPGRAGSHPLGDASPAPRDDLVSMIRDELAQHTGVPGFRRALQTPRATVEQDVFRGHQIPPPSRTPSASCWSSCRRLCKSWAASSLGSRAFDARATLIPLEPIQIKMRYLVHQFEGGAITRTLP